MKLSIWINIGCTTSLLFLLHGKRCDAQALAQAKPLRVSDNLLYQQTFSDNLEFIKQYNQVAAFSKALDLNGLAKTADKLENSFDNQPSNRKVYFALMDSITADMSSYDFGISNNNKKMTLARKYVLLALQKPNVPLDVAFHLLPRIEYEDGWEYSEGKITKEVWATQRLQRTRSWFDIWNRIDQVTDKNFNPHQRGPRGTYYNALINRATLPPSGITPEQHQKDVEELSSIRHEFSSQIIMQQLHHDFLLAVDSAISDAYAKPTYKTEELVQLLKDYHIDESEQSEVLGHARDEIASKKNASGVNL